MIRDHSILVIRKRYTLSVQLGITIQILCTGREFKGAETCGHVMTRKGTPLKISFFFSMLQKQQ